MDDLEELNKLFQSGESYRQEDFYFYINQSLKFCLFVRLKNYLIGSPITSYIYLQNLNEEKFRLLESQNKLVDFKFLKAKLNSLKEYLEHIVKETLKKDLKPSLKKFFKNSKVDQQEKIIITKNYNTLIKDIRRSLKKDNSLETNWFEKYLNNIRESVILFDMHIFHPNLEKTTEIDTFFYDEFIKESYENIINSPNTVLLSKSLYLTSPVSTFLKFLEFETSQPEYIKVQNAINNNAKIKHLELEFQKFETTNFDVVEDIKLKRIYLFDEIRLALKDEVVIDFSSVIISSIKIFNILKFNLDRKTEKEDEKFNNLNEFILKKCTTIFNPFQTTLEDLIDIFDEQNKYIFVRFYITRVLKEYQVDLLKSKINLDCKKLIYNNLKTTLNNAQMSILKSSDDTQFVSFMFKEDCNEIQNNFFRFYENKILYAKEFKEVQDFILTLNNPAVLGLIVGWGESFKDIVLDKDRQKLEEFLNQVKNLLNKEGLIFAESKGRKEAEEKIDFNFEKYYNLFKENLASQENAKNLDFDVVELFEKVATEYYNKGTDIFNSFASGEYFYNIIKNVVGLKETTNLDLTACYINVLKGIEQFMCAIINYACKLNIIDIADVKNFFVESKETNNENSLNLNNSNKDKNVMDYSSLKWEETLKSYKDIVDFLSEKNLISSKDNLIRTWGKTRNPLAHKRNIYKFDIKKDKDNVFDISYMLLVQMLKEIKKWRTK